MPRLVAQPSERPERGMVLIAPGPWGCYPIIIPSFTGAFCCWCAVGYRLQHPFVPKACLSPPQVIVAFSQTGQNCLI